MADHVARVAALLAKAESTNFPEEAEAALTKAQELMKLHAISDAMLENSGQKQREGIIESTLLVLGPYMRAKNLLLTIVAEANGCESVFRDPKRGDKALLAYVIGPVEEVEAVRTLFASLLTCATRAMLNSSVPHYETTKSFRQSFLIGFANRIGQRFAEANATVIAEAEEEHGPGVALVMMKREALVKQHVEEKYNPGKRATGSKGRSFAAGAAAADQADLGQRILPEGAKALGEGN